MHATTLTTSSSTITTTTTTNTDGLYTYMGSDEPYISGNDGRLKNNVFEGNTISNTDVGIKIKEADDNTFKSESTGVFYRGLSRRPVYLEICRASGRLIPFANRDHGVSMRDSGNVKPGPWSVVGLSTFVLAR